MMLRVPALLLLIPVATLLAGCSRDPVELRLIAPQLAFDQQIVSVLQEALEDSPHFRLALVPHSEQGKSTLDLLEAGVADMALVPNNEAYRSGVETVIPLYPTVLHIAHRKDVEPTNTADLLAGKTVFAGPPGSPSRIMLEQTAARLGVSTDSIRFVESATSRPDVIVLFAPVKPGLMDDLPDYRLFSLGTVEQLGRGSKVESVSLLHPQFQPFILPEGTYQGATDKAVVTVAVDKLLVARSDLSPTMVHDLISEILRLRPALSAAYPGVFRQLTGDFDASNSTFVVHPGAQAYIERDAPSIYERYSGVAEVVVTLLIGVISGSYAIARIYRIRRKNHIDSFYGRAIAIRRSFLANRDAAARASAVEEIRALQDEAFELLASEKLSADDSFRIFMTLSNDIIADLRS